jgi:hypothetical protein
MGFAPSTIGICRPPLVAPAIDRQGHSHDGASCFLTQTLAERESYYMATLQEQLEQQVAPVGGGDAHLFRNA